MKRLISYIHNNVDTIKQKHAVLKTNVKKHIHKKVQHHHSRWNLHKFWNWFHHTVHHVEHISFLLWWLMLFFWITSFASFGWWINEYLLHPFKYITTIECRTKFFEDITLEDDCIIDMPVIEQWNYTKYELDKVYRDAYTALWWSPYVWDSWDNEHGAHDGVDIATSRWTPLYAIANWTVWFAWEQTGYWNVVKISFNYKGEVYWALYAHMDKILVKAWDTVSQWDKIWTVWNSWLTFGALWGYHLHFEIAKNNVNRPMYWFTGCKDLDKDLIDIINNWLCRNELAKNTFDPIAFIENSRSHLTKNNIPEVVVTDTVEWTTPPWDFSSFKKVSVVSSTGWKIESWSLLTGWIAGNISTATSWLDVWKSDKPLTNNWFIKVVVKEDQSDILKERGQVTALESDIDYLSAQWENVDLDTILPSKVNFAVQQFLANYEVKLAYKKLSLNKVVIKFEAYSKKSGEEYNGIMPFGITFLSNDEWVKFSKSNLRIINDGLAQIDVDLNWENDKSIIIMLDVLKWGTIKL